MSICGQASRPMSISVRVFDTVSTYRALREQVAALFTAVFNRPFPAATWDQWYFENPGGPPIVAVGFDQDRVVAHHALVRQTLQSPAGELLRCVLSISTMVHPEYRKLGAFVQLVEAVHIRAEQARIPFILAFPNSTSAPFFHKLCGYTPIRETELMNWKPVPAVKEGRNAAAEIYSAPHCSPIVNQWSVPCDSEYWIWRTRVNHAVRQTLDNNIQIVYVVLEHTTLMLLDVETPQFSDVWIQIAALANSLGLTEIRLTRYHAELIGVSASSLVSHQGYVVRFYVFPIAQTVPPIRLNLLLSDVF